MVYGYKNTFTKLSELKAWCNHKGTKIALCVGVEGPYVFCEKGHFFKSMEQSGDFFCDYDGNPVTVDTEGMVAYVGRNVHTTDCEV